MAVSTAAYLRRLLGDPIRATSQYVYGDGTATAFQLSGFPVYSGTAPSVRLLSGLGALTATGGTAWDHENGTVAFATALSAGSAALVTYRWSVLSEEEVGFLTGAYASLDQMARAGIEMFQMDYARRVKWSMAQGPGVDPTEAAKHLAALWKQYSDKLHEESDGLAIAGGLESWAESFQSQGYP